MLPVGYCYRSIEFIVKTVLRVEAVPESERPALLREIDAAGVVATPANSSYNELVVEAGRLSITHGGRLVEIVPGEPPRVQF